jgi:hypothetical protein
MIRADLKRVQIEAVVLKDPRPEAEDGTVYDSPHIIIIKLTENLLHSVSSMMLYGNYYVKITQMLWKDKWNIGRY